MESFAYNPKSDKYFNFFDKNPPQHEISRRLTLEQNLVIFFYPTRFLVNVT